MILYHGSSAGWLDQSGFARTKHAFGEACPPHDFLHLSTTKEGAINAADIACRGARRRIESNDYALKAEDFYFGSKQYLPCANLYSVDIPCDVPIFDWSKEGALGATEWEKIRTVLQCFHSKGGLPGKLEFLTRLTMYGLNNTRWKEWIDFVCDTYMEGRSMDLRMKFFANAGYQLVKNLEGDGDGQGYGTVYTMVLPKEGSAPWIPILVQSW